MHDVVKSICFFTTQRQQSAALEDISVNNGAYALICDDHPLVCRGLQELLKDHPRLHHSVATHSQDECLAYMREQLQGGHLPAIAIIDFWLSDDACEPLIRALREHARAMPILVMSADDDPIVQQKSQQWGAQGFINKQANPGVIREAVLIIMQGMNWFMPAEEASSRPSSIRQNQWPITPRELGLTARQAQILGMILQGQPNKRIAQSLSLTEATVKEHVTAILHKLGVKSRVEAIAKLQNRRLENW
jgi:DNA-binding NarL/FixJ family response regulator